MAGKHVTRIVKADIIDTDEIHADLVKDDKGVLFLSVRFATEHGWTRDKMMSLDNWDRICVNADEIAAAVYEARQDADEIKRREARKALYESQRNDLGKARPFLGESAYASAEARLKAQYPDLFPVDVKEEDPIEDPVDAE